MPVGPVATGILLSQVCFAHKIGALGPSTGTYPAVLHHSKAEVVSTSVNHSMKSTHDFLLSNPRLRRQGSNLQKRITVIITFPSEKFPKKLPFPPISTFPT